MSVSSISQANKFILWGKAAGRCQYRGCNKSLFVDALTKGEFNQAYIAHIVADVPGGPRGDVDKSPLLKDKITNLMLLCDTHHRLIDKIDVAGHSVELLTQMKQEHEQRIERVASIQDTNQSQIVLYRANVGKHTPALTYELVAPSLLPEYYPATSDAIDLGLSNSVSRDDNDAFWAEEVRNLNTQFDEQLRPKLRRGDIEHMTVFAFAPMPLLIKLGTLINDVQNIEVRQPIRETKSWKWDDNCDDVEYRIIRPDEKKSVVALNISLSGTINADRISNVLGEDVSIYTITIETPFNDFLRCKKHLEAFSKAVRLLLNEIKSEFGEQVELNVFPAMPIAAAIEFGRVWMPKADLPMVIYDQNTKTQGFQKAITINNN